MQGLASEFTALPKMELSANLQPCPSPVSIAAKPAVPSFNTRSAAMPIALKRPIRKVSFSDLSSLDHSTDSEQQSASLYSSVPRKSSSFSRSYSLRDAFSNKVPLSPSCSHHSAASASDEIKVRGGHLFNSEPVSSSDSLSTLDPAFSGIPDSTSYPSSACDASSIPSQSPSRNLIPSESASAQGTSNLPQDLPELAYQRQQDSGIASQHSQLPGTDSSKGSIEAGLLNSYDSDKSVCGSKTHGGNLFKQGELHFLSVRDMLLT